MMKSTQKKTILKTLLVVTSFLVGFSSSFSSSLFAEPLPLSKEGPAVFQPGGGTNSGPPGGPVKPATGDSEKPFVSFKTSEQRKLVFPAPAVGKGEAGRLAALDKETKKKWLKTLKEFNQNLPQEVEEERAIGKKEYDLVYNDSITDAKNPVFNPLLRSPHIDGPILVEESSVDAFNANKRTPTLNLNLEGIASFQGKNRDAESLGFTEKLVEVTRDPELALAVGIDVIGGSVIRPFFNSAMKVGEELTRQIECASSGLSVSNGCGTPSEWQDYWAGLMTGEAKPYLLTDVILDSVFAIPGIAAAGAVADASVEALKKVPAALKEAAVVVEQSADALKAVTPALSFSIDAQVVLAKEADNAVKVSTEAIQVSSRIPDELKEIWDVAQNWSTKPNGLGGPLNAYQHAEAHMKEFPEILTKREFVIKAQSFVSNPPERALVKIRESNGDLIIYEESTNIFAVKNSKGQPKTFFKPTEGKAYYDRQK